MFNFEIKFTPKNLIFFGLFLVDLFILIRLGLTATIFAAGVEAIIAGVLLLIAEDMR